MTEKKEIKFRILVEDVGEQISPGGFSGAFCPADTGIQCWSRI
ncbi:MAG: hypothetical protein ACFFBD_22960 [Candidatus Hodarchaeota archaeon]